MRMKAILISSLMLMAGLVLPTTFGQNDEDVRGAFLTTRPRTTPKTSKPPAIVRSRRRPKTTVPDSAGTKVATQKKESTSGSTPAKVNIPRIGLGLTLFKRDSNGLAVRTDPAREFVKGDRVRFLIETNTDGYLYVFNTTDNGQPVMLYPDPELDEAGNYFQAHVPFEIPSSVAPEERLRWLTFDEHPGAEKLYFVFTREPLSGVPIEDDLITYCRESDAKCPWHPGTGVWAQIQNELNEPIKVAKSDKLGKTQTSPEHLAATRGIGLNRDDPEPSLIMLTASTSKNMLVAAVNLIHKSASASRTEDGQ